jgi:hypothetical protein
VALDDASPVGEKVRDDVRLIQARVLRLNVEHLVLELDVVVEAHLRAPKARALHLGFELLKLGVRVVLDVGVELAVIAGHSLHALERHLGDPRGRIDAQCLGEQALTVGVVRPGCGPGCEQSDRVVRAALLDQPLGNAQRGRALVGH